jgi:hypothetical protein
MNPEKLINNIKGLIYALAFLLIAISILIGVLVLNKLAGNAGDYINHVSGISASSYKAEAKAKVKQAIKRDRAKIGGMTGKEIEAYSNKLFGGQK